MSRGRQGSMQSLISMYIVCMGPRCCLESVADPGAIEYEGHVMCRGRVGRRIAMVVWVWYCSVNLLVSFWYESRLCIEMTFLH